MARLSWESVEWGGTWKARFFTHPSVSHTSFGTIHNFHDYGNVDRWNEWPAGSRVMDTPLAKQT